MLDTNKKNYYWKLISDLRGYVPFYGFTGAMIQIMFIKYLCTFEDDFLLADDLKVLMKLQRMLMANEVDFDTIAEAYHMMDKMYCSGNGVLVNALDSLRRIFNNEKRLLISVINMVEIPSDKEELKDLILFVISSGENGDISRTGESTTNTSLIKLVNSILNVNIEDIFMDCFCGLNKTALNVNAKEYYGYEINAETSAISLISMIMAGKRNFRVDNNDYYFINHKSFANKVFSDGPINLIMREEIVDKYRFGRKSDIYNILLPLQDLSDDGIAAITTPSGCLSSNQKTYIEFRKKIIEDLKAVISLPPLWLGTSINTNLLIFDRKNKSDKVVFIDATNTGTLVKQTRQYALNDEEILKITNAINGEEIEEFSCRISKEELLNNEVILQPNRFLKKKIQREYRNVSDIDNDLRKLYTELNELINK